MAVETRAGFVAIIGAPNVGKSTLLNALVGAKVSIVSPKVQTTRRRIIGITIKDQCQIMFVDTPGIFEPKKRLDRAMVSAAWSGSVDSNLTLFLVDAKKGLDQQSRMIKETIAQKHRRALLVINKIDLVSRDRLLPLAQAGNENAQFEQTFMISAQEGDGTALLLAQIAAAMPEGPWLYPEDQLSDLSNRAMAAEITREKIFLALNEELPYAITVETEGWVENDKGSEVRIDQTIYVMRPTQKAIVLGKNGRQIKAIGQSARLELETLLDCRVHLFLFVKVRERWADDPERYREIGLDFPE